MTIVEWDDIFKGPISLLCRYITKSMYDKTNSIKDLAIFEIDYLIRETERQEVNLTRTFYGFEVKILREYLPIVKNAILNSKNKNV